MQNQTINFFENYNGKLFNDAFSTIRPKDESFKIGQIFDLTLNQNWCGDAEIVYTKDFYINQLNDAMAYLDSGLSAKELVYLLNEFYNYQVSNINTAVFTYIVLRRVTKDRSRKAPINQLYNQA